MFTPLPIKRSSKYGNNYWESFSPKMKRNVRLFSDLEYDHWILVETDPNVKAFCEQPLEIKQGYKGKVVRSIPDMWILHVDGKQCFVEVKYSKDLENDSPKYEQTRKQTTVQEHWCRENGYAHHVKTEKNIRSNTIFLDNKKIMLPYLQYANQINELDEHLLLQLLSTPRSLQTIYSSLLHLGKSRVNQTLFRLIYLKKVAANLDEVPFGFATEVRLYAEKKSY